METRFIKNQQLEYVEQFVQKTNSHIFLTGNAGTGKTTFLRNLQSVTDKRFVVVAPTGVAAINAGGVTIHSFFQLPFGPQLPDVPLEHGKHKLNATKLKIIRSLDLLVIDEISMVRADLLDAIDMVLRSTRRNSQPFGGVQLLMIGDVHQLAPVAKPDEWELLQPFYDSVYFFSSLVWKSTSFICVELQTVYRQHDLNFVGLLNSFRDGHPNKESIDKINERFNPTFNPDDEEGYITLTTHNFQADEINKTKLEALDTEDVEFEAAVEGTFPESIFPTEKNLILKIGEQVMFIKNDPSSEKQFYNGKVGRIVAIDDDSVAVDCGDRQIAVGPLRWDNNEYSINPDTKEIEEKQIGSFTQIPLRPAWAITIHKSQGLTFGKVIIDANLAFAHGQVYVALSRCTSFEGLVLRSKISESGMRTDGSVDDFLNNLPNIQPSTDKLNSLSAEFEHQLLNEMFDFAQIRRQVERLSKIVSDNSSLFPTDTLTAINDTRTKLNNLADVWLRFRNQLERFYSAGLTASNSRQLQERISKGSAYFLESADSVLQLKELELKTDNKEINSSIKDALIDILSLWMVKRALLDLCKGGFNMEKYLHERNIKSVEAEEKIPRQLSVAERKTVTKEGADLYDKLKRWRNDKAAELGCEASKIISLKLLVEISDLKPTSLKQLRKMKGFGKIKEAKFGQAILDIVSGASDEKRYVQQTTNEQSTSLPRSAEITKQLLDEGLTIDEIADKRGLTQSSVEEHVCKLIAAGKFNVEDYVPKSVVDLVIEYFTDTQDPSIGAAKIVLQDDASFFEIKAVLAQLRLDKKVKF